MEAVDALLKTDNVALLMALAWILYMHKQVARANELADKLRAKNDELTGLVRDAVSANKSNAQAIRQLRRVFERSYDMDETGEFDARDIARD